MPQHIAPTKTNLLKLKKTLALTREGHGLLDEKRKILINEMATIIHIVDNLQHNVDVAMRDAYMLMDKAIVVMGRKRLEELSFCTDIKTMLSITKRRIMAVNMPVIDLKITENPPYCSTYEVSLYVDEAMSAFKEALRLISQLAEKKIALMWIAKEVQKTIRKVNALEKIYLPYYGESVKYINDRLDEESRESFSMSKLIKERLKFAH